MALSRRERRALHHHVPDSGRIDQLGDAYRGPWLESRSEFDRQLMALSTAGVGLLVGLASTHPPTTGATRTATAVALLGFVLVVLLTLGTLRLDARFLEAESRLTGASHKQQVAEHEALGARLRLLGRVSVWAFGVAIAATAVVGAFALFGSY